MKRVIKANSNADFWNTDEQYVPKEFTMDFVKNTVLPLLTNKINQVCGKRFKNLSIDFDDMAVGGKTGRSLRVVVMIYNNSQLKKQGTFTFGAYSDYWEEDDFTQHLNRSIHDFVVSM